NACLPSVDWSPAAMPAAICPERRRVRWTMRRGLSIVGLFLATLLAFPQPARADFWDWLQEFSGPGPFHARLPNLMFDICPGEALPFDVNGRTLPEPATQDERERKQRSFLRDFDEPTPSTLSRNNVVRVPKCIYADLRFFQNRED